MSTRRDDRGRRSVVSYVTNVYPSKPTPSYAARLEKRMFGPGMSILNTFVPRPALLTPAPPQKTPKKRTTLSRELLSLDPSAILNAPRQRKAPSPLPSQPKTPGRSAKRSAARAAVHKG